ncbi:MAG: 4Fe-4S dicluster domain-containing protein [Oscillospiraceae bacterium]|nr:MAG: 4Fe-4S dicluster domain-containing protein [Oscillospiraceae bacterium]
MDTRKCMKCGKCSASCPSFDEMEYHPHQFVAMVTKGDIDRLMASPSIYKCLSCFACVERCPRGVEPAAVVEAIRTMAERRQGGTYFSPDEVPEKIDGSVPQQALVSAFRKYRK